MQRAFKGVWIPADIWLSEDLSLQEKVFLAEIDSLDNKDGCFASNKYFAKFFGLTNGRCSQIISSLKSKGLISIDYVYGKNKEIEKRVIKVVNKLNTPIKYSKEGVKNTKDPYLENAKDNNPCINNPINNTLEQLLQHEGAAEIIQFWDNNGFGYNNVNAKHKLLSWLDDSNFKNPSEMILKALDIASTNDRRTLAYVEGILRNWTNESILTVDEVKDRPKQTNNSEFSYDPAVDSF